MDTTPVTKSAFQTPITIEEIIDGIHRKKYLLPAIQREFVWSTDQIVKLFDSLMRDYTIGSFLFWNVDKEKLKDFQFYEFIRDYHERNNTHNPQANITGDDSIISILDGQQRLTSLYIGLKGSYAYKTPWKKFDSIDAYPKRKLYLNVLSPSKEVDLLYDFRFLTKEETLQRDDTKLWFEVSRIVEFNGLRNINQYMRDNDLLKSSFAEECLFKLYEVINQNQVINYYLETSQNLDKVLNIFIRVNSGGTKLSYSDLLLSTATAQWTNYDAKEEITSLVDELNKVRDGFDFNKDLVLKSCLVLSDLPDIAFKVDNFTKDNMRKMEDNWTDYSRSLKLSVDLVASYGYNAQTLTANNALIPISYYILKRDNPINFTQHPSFFDDREVIRKYLTVSLVKRIFGGQPDNVLRSIRNILQDNHSHFPYDEIINKFKGTNKSFTFTDDEIDNLLQYKYGQDYTFPVLSLLYSTLDYKNKFHIDHIYPKSFFKTNVLKDKGIPREKHKFYQDNYNCIGNLQFLEGLPNILKSSMDFKKWLDNNFTGDKRLKFLQINHIPEDISLEFDNFDEFINERNKLLVKEFARILQ